MQERLFRKEAIERLSSPEQLDQLMKVTSSRSWLALLAISLLIGAAAVWGWLGRIPTTVTGEGILLKGGINNISATAAGQLDDIYVNVGEIIEKGQVVTRVLTNSGENIRVESPLAGRVIEVRASGGSFVEVGTPLINIEPSGADVKDLEAILYLPASEGKKIQPGMKVQIVPSTVRAEETGVMLGWVLSVSEFPESQESMRRLLENEDLVARFFNVTDNAPIQVRVDLTPSRETVSGYKWSSPDGAQIEVQSGTLFEATIILKEQAPLQLIFPFVG